MSEMSYNTNEDDVMQKVTTPHYLLILTLTYNFPYLHV